MVARVRGPVGGLRCHRNRRKPIDRVGFKDYRDGKDQSHEAGCHDSPEKRSPSSSSLPFEIRTRPRGGHVTRRVLLAAEAVTLAHLARPLAIGRALEAMDWQVTLACDPRFRGFLGDFHGKYRELRSVQPEVFLAALRRGTPLYDVETLNRYVVDDLRVIGEVKPDLIVGDFRLSLSVSARLARVPYVALANAYWSPFYEPGKWPVPELWLTKLLPIAVAERVFRVARPAAFALHSRPLNRVRKRHCLADLGLSLRRVYTDADFVAYADAPALFPIATLPATHRFIGPALWEPPVSFPPWWSELREDRPMVYVTLGSSGQASLLPAVAETLGALDLSVVIATAGRARLPAPPPNTRVAEFLPGTQVARRADIVVCNGGSLTCYQALSAGVPVIGIASNLDQFLNMQAVERIGAGLSLRADRFRPAELLRVVRQVLDDARFRTSAKRVADWCTEQPLAGAVRDLLQGIVRP